jgi:hypothetical protein
MSDLIQPSASSRVPYTPAIDKALAYLAEIKDPRSYSIRRLARNAGVSLVTMWKAMHRHSAPEIAPAAAPRSRPEPKRAWQRLRDAIARDLLQGWLSRREYMPNVKELCAHYGAGAKSMRRALEELRAKGTIDRTGRRYGTRRARTAGISSIKVSVLVFTWKDEMPVLFADYNPYFIRGLEQECVIRGIGVELHGYWREGPHVVTSSASRAGRRALSALHEHAGFMHLAFWPSCVEPAVLSMLRGTDKPVAIIDEIGGWEVPECLISGNRALVINARPFEAGAAEIARALIACGHHHVAFFSPFENDPWSHRCRDGLVSAFSGAGSGYRLALFTEKGSSLLGDDTFIGRAQKHSADHRLRNYYAKWRKNLDPSYTTQLDPHFHKYLLSQLWYAEVRRTLRPLFERAYADKSITCWVAVDTDVAWFAHDFLRAKASDLSLVTFGNSPEVSQRGITAYDFNADGAARAALEFVLYPDRKLPGQTGHALTIDGMLVDRGSLRPV